MKVTLNIENDEELRLHIKDLIRGQVLSITREEIEAVIKEELNRKIKATSADNISYIYRNEVKSAIKELAREDMKISQWNDDFVKPVLEEAVKETLKLIDIKKLVNSVARTKLLNLIDKV